MMNMSYCLLPEMHNTLFISAVSDKTAAGDIAIFSNSWLSLKWAELSAS